MAMGHTAVRGTKEEALDLLRGEFERLNAELRDIKAKLDSSRGQVEQLAQRNAVVVGEIRRIEGSLDQATRENIKDTYTEALDSQHRLMTARAQMEKLQAQEAIARREVDSLKAAIDVLSKQDMGGDSSPGGSQMSGRELIIRVIDAQEEERERLARAMHDGPAIR
jgi:two-component system sensor histidine kinase DegS